MPIRSRGFTLLEMVISILVLGIIGAVVASGIQGGVLAFTHTSNSLESIGKIRFATERVVRELREIRRDPGNTARYQISEPFSATTITFVKNDATTVTISSAPPLLSLSYNSPIGTFTLTDQVTSFTFAYFQIDGTTVSSVATNVAFIELEIVSTDGNGNSLMQRSRIGLRNQP